MKNELLPCPFCGCDAIIQDWSGASEIRGDTIQSTWIECTKCGAGFSGEAINGVEPEPTIFTKWNMRK